MSLHPQVVQVLELIKSRNLPPVEEQELDTARAMYVKSSRSLNKFEDVLKVEDKKIQGYKQEITVRIYTPNEEPILPVFIYFHGGGWVIGNVDSHDALCRMFANESQCKVISVDYSLAPEHKFPTGVEDAYLASKWVYEQSEELGIDKNRIAVGGDSAGGNLATIVCYLANQRKEFTLQQQLLFYPSTGFEPTESYIKYCEGHYLTKSTMQWFSLQYFNEPSETRSPLASPILIPDEEAALLPPAYIVTAEYDPLCDGGRNYANKLSDLGVNTTYICYPGMIHGFMCMTALIENGEKAIREAAQYLRRALI
ncbi:alpha/beta hydrolase [Bacillus pinisoli]|uniref:alpha/beta hydrolase n=1 Tax=Bacillus pinisoli TaxID=2901866 RepID=UPI001FF63C33|nr:alpha/beta hydrolase [Bacillus pinisoli]